MERGGGESIVTCVVFFCVCYAYATCGKYQLG